MWVQATTTTITTIAVTRWTFGVLSSGEPLFPERPCEGKGERAPLADNTSGAQDAVSWGLIPIRGVVLEINRLGNGARISDLRVSDCPFEDLSMEFDN